jgi:dihydrofolate reductase
MKISMIAAVAKNHVIGKDNDLIWHLPNDLKYFKEKTKGHTIIMGRKTWESIGSRPLPKRTNIVVTRQANFSAEGALVVNSISQAIGLSPEDDDELFIVGGAEIYKQAMVIADCIYITLVDAEPEGDTHFPPIPSKDFKLISQEHHPTDERHAMAYSFQEYKRVY